MSNFNDSTLGPSEPMDPFKGTSGSTTGRGDGEGDSGNVGGDGGSSAQYSSRKAGVVIRATVEHMGLVGDTELTVNVRWPASTFCVPSCGKPAGAAGPTTDTQRVPANGPLADFGPIYGPSADPGPAINTATAAAAKSAAAAADTSGTASAGVPATAQAKALESPQKTTPDAKQRRRKPVR
jgi:hypothetical protein